MNWRERVQLLLGFASPLTLVAHPALATTGSSEDGPKVSIPPIDRDFLIFRDPAERARLLLFAGHSSHSSHSSHASHASHSSGSSGGYYTAEPDYSYPLLSPPPPPQPPAPPAPRSSTPRSFLGSSDNASSDAGASAGRSRLGKDELSEMVTKVQIALIVRGYDPGSVNGVLSPKTKGALSQFQSANHLPATGFMDLPTLRLLDVVQ